MAYPVTHITDRISVTSYNRTLQKTKKNSGFVTYECQGGEQIRSKFRFRDLMTDVRN